MDYVVPVLLLLSAFGVLIATFAGVSRLGESVRVWMGIGLIGLTCGSLAYSIVEFSVWVAVQAIITALYFLFYPVDSFARYNGVLAPLIVLVGLGISMLVFTAIGGFFVFITNVWVGRYFGVDIIFDVLYLTDAEAWMLSLALGVGFSFLLIGRPLLRKAKTAVKALAR